MGKHPETTEATRQALVDAFCILSREKPFEKITVQEIARKAGYNRCTFYQYFKDVYDLRDHIGDIVISQIKENFQNNIRQEDFNRTFFDAFTRIHQERSAFFGLLLSPAHRGYFTGKLMAEALPVFMRRFRLPETSPRADYLAAMYFATVIAAISHWIDHGRALPLQDLSEMLGNTLAHGVMPEIANCR